MPTLHIEHPITDFGAWNSAFARFAEARRQAGVRAQRIQRPAGDPNYVVIDLDFGTYGEAETFCDSSRPRSGEYRRTRQRWPGARRR
jgi:hypothetical protein